MFVTILRLQSVIHIEQFNPTVFRYQLELDPKSWLYNSGLNSIDIVQRIKAYIHDSLTIISNQSIKFTAERFE